MGPGTAVDTVHVGTVEEQLTGQAWFIEGRTMTLVEQPDVYDGGVLVARYRWPPHVHLGHLPWVTGSALYGTTRDELDVERVG